MFTNENYILGIHMGFFSLLLPFLLTVSLVFVHIHSLSHSFCFTISIQLHFTQAIYDTYSAKNSSESFWILILTANIRTMEMTRQCQQWMNEDSNIRWHVSIQSYSMFCTMISLWNSCTNFRINEDSRFTIFCKVLTYTQKHTLAHITRIIYS